MTGAKKQEVINGLANLKPCSILDKFGEVVSEQELQADLEKLLDFVQDWVSNIFQSEQALAELGKAINSLEKKPKSPAELARQIDYQIDINKLPERALSKSRINKLAGYSLIANFLAWDNSLDPDKGKPGVSPTLNLGAVDKQLASLTVNDTENKLILRVKLWQNEYQLHYKIPRFIQQREVIKWSLPSIRLDQERGFLFDFAYLEQVETGSNNSGASAWKQYTAGIDLGKCKSYQAVVINQAGLKLAEYQTSGFVKLAYQKLDRATTNRRNVQRKISIYQQLKVEQERIDTLKLESRRLKNKAARLRKALAQQGAAQLVGKLDKHNISNSNIHIHLEDLSWVKGEKYGSHWDHSQQGEALEHRAARAGIKTRRVNPKNTSQVCSECHSKLVKQKDRRIKCPDCQSLSDRDVNAALNIARDLNNYELNRSKSTKRFSSLWKRKVRNDCSFLGNRSESKGFAKSKSSRCKVNSRKNHHLSLLSLSGVIANDKQRST